MLCRRTDSLKKKKRITQKISPTTQNKNLTGKNLRPQVRKKISCTRFKSAGQKKD
jgi:hypothetical protein